MAVDNQKIAEGVLANVGGADNIASATHCMTRLRLTFKDKSKVDSEEIKKITGVLGINWAGEQCQVIIGQNVPKVYDAVLAKGVKGGGAIDENLDKDLTKEKLTPKAVGNKILDYLSGSMVQMIPLIMASGLFRTFAVVMGPQMFNLWAADSGIYSFFYTTLYEAGFYFLPIYLGYCAAKRVGANPLLGLLSGGILIAPTIVTAAANGATINVYGIDIAAANYSQSVLPVILTVPVLAVVEKFMRKHVPDVLSTLFTPFFTMAVVVPIELIVLAPIGNLLGQGIAAIIFGLAGLGGAGVLIVMAVLGAFWQFFVVAGMHMPVILLAQVTLLQTGVDPFLFVATNCAAVAVWGCAIGAFLRIRNKEEKGLAAGYVAAAIVGGVTEPALFGIVLRFRRTMYGMFVGGAIGAVVSGILGVHIYVGAMGSGLLMILGYVQGGAFNTVAAVIGLVVSCVVAAAVVYFTGFTKEELAALDNEKPGDMVVE
ncbi:MAG: PTS transporter subunit EIIC [Atopobiaceae bacterium]